MASRYNEEQKRLADLTFLERVRACTTIKQVERMLMDHRRAAPWKLVALRRKHRVLLNAKYAAHANAEPHARLMQELRQMTPAEVVETAKRAGIYDDQGRITSEFGGEPILELDDGDIAEVVDWPVGDDEW